MLGLYRDIYRGFTAKHFHEQLGKRHHYMLGYTVTKLHLHRAGLVQAATKRSAHRKQRPRRPMVGMMLHQNASTHAWLPSDAGKHDLVVTMGDATSAICSAFLVDQEGSAFVADTMEAWHEILCIQEDWTVGNDITVKWQRRSLQLPPSRLRPHFVKATVRVVRNGSNSSQNLSTGPGLSRELTVLP
jgi:hypothetical protein